MGFQYHRNILIFFGVLYVASLKVPLVFWTLVTINYQTHPEFHCLQRYHGVKIFTSVVVCVCLHLCLHALNFLCVLTKYRKFRQKLVNEPNS